MNKSNHIYCKKKALSKFYCDELIKFFDIYPWSKSGHAGVNGISKVDRSHKNSIDVPLIMHDPLNPLYTTLELVLAKNLKEYVKRYPFMEKIDKWSVYEGANIQKYNVNGGYVTEHCEYGYDKDRSCSSRVLAWMFYLNDVTDKGGTCFPSQNITLKARVGDLYIWPAYFTHSHYGVPSPSQIKYIATGWCNFNELTSIK